MRYQRTGRAGANTGGCKVSFSDKHNERKGRTEEIPTNPNTSIRPELTRNNSTWKAVDVPSLWRLGQAIRRDYAATERTVSLKDGTTHKCHRELPSKGKTAATPIKETVLNLPTNGSETDAMVEEFAKRVEALTGWRCIRRYVHRDERYDDPDTGEQHFNCHGHLVWDCYDWQRHEIRKVGKATMRQIQDIAAEVTGMERGVDARVTKAEHLNVATFKNEQERQRAEDLKAQNLALQQEVAATRTQLTADLQQNRSTLVHLGGNMVTQFDRLSKHETPTKAEQESRDLLAEECRRQAAEADNELRQQVVLLHRLLDRTAAAVHALTARIITQAAAAKRSLAAAVRRTKVAKFLVPSADLREVATIGEMEARVAESERKARISLEKEKNAEKRAEIAENDMRAAEKALSTAIEDGARPWRSKCRELQAQVDSIPNQLAKARQSGLDEGGRALEATLDPFRKENALLKQQLETVRTLNTRLQQQVQNLQLTKSKGKGKRI